MDAISPYLFVLCMVRLGHLVNQAMTNGRWKPIKLAKYGPSLSHLFFADDLLLFAEATEDQIITIMDCLNLFCSASGQKISLQKSNIFFSRGVEERTATNITVFAQINSKTSLDKYLGTPSLTGRIHTDLFRQLWEKIEERLDGWKAKHLSLEGINVLADQSVLIIIPFC